MEQNSLDQPPSSPVHVPWTGDPLPPPPTVDPNDTAHLLAHITTFRKDPIPSQPYHHIMDAGFDPNTQVVSQSISLGAQEGRADYKWLLSSQDLPSGSAEQQGSALNRHHQLPPIETLPPFRRRAFNHFNLRYNTPKHPSRRSLQREAHFVTPNCLLDIIRHIIRETVIERDVSATLAAAPEVIFVHSSSVEPCDVIIPPSRPEIVRDQFPELWIRDFLTSIHDALQAPEGSLERIHNNLMVELSQDVSDSQTGYAHFYLQSPLQFHKDNDFPATVEDLNLSTALVVAALDCGVEDHRGDLEQAGVTPSSWFCLTSVVLRALARGALRSRGRKIQGQVTLDDDTGDEWWVAEGVVPPVMQGGHIVAQAQQIAQFFAHYAGTDKPPFANFYDSIIRIGQNHIEKVVRLKAAATYQITTSDVQGLTDMVLDDMSKQLYTHMTSDEEARKHANQLTLDRLFAEAQDQLNPFMEE
ncbi:hypothetical protein BJY52DRAFT_1188994 [Lactarius psammicola]|nr:hypothetical protein BJY52DRAFT_1188994 [Lactarius psammicola]